MTPASADTLEAALKDGEQPNVTHATTCTCNDIVRSHARAIILCTTFGLTQMLGSCGPGSAAC